jgi:hypothetical protein
MVGGTASLTVCPFLVTLRIISEGISGQEARGRNGWARACRHARRCIAAVRGLRSTRWRRARGRGVGIEPGGRGAAVPRTDPASVGHRLAPANPAPHAAAHADPDTEADADAHATTDTEADADAHATTDSAADAHAKPIINANPAAHPLPIGVTNPGADRNAVTDAGPSTNANRQRHGSAASATSGATAECSRAGHRRFTDYRRGADRISSGSGDRADPAASAVCRRHRYLRRFAELLPAVDGCGHGDPGAADADPTGDRFDTALTTT